MRFLVSAFALVASLAGCGGLPVAHSGATANATAPQATLQQKRSWISPAALRHKDLLYVANYNKVYVFTFPGGDVEEELTGLSRPYGICTDRKGRIYITDFGKNAVAEFAHGGTHALRSLSVPGNAPAGCAVDPKSGDLAVTSYGTASGGGAGLAVYRKAKGTPKVYTDPDLVNYADCSYDDSGNLFVVGSTSAHSYGTSKLAELPRNGASLLTVSLDYNSGWLAGVRWDGQYLAVGQSVLPSILRYKIADGGGTYVGRTPLTDSYAEQNFIIVGDQAIVVNLYYYDTYLSKYQVLVYDYPAGGNSTNLIMDSIAPVTSVALSPARK